MQVHTVGVLMVIASACGFATLAVLIKVAYAAQAEMLTVLAYRFLFAAVLFWLVIRVRHLQVQITSRELVKLVLLGGIGYGLMSGLFAGTLIYLPASLAGMLLYTYPALVCVFSYLLGEEHLSGKKIVALIMCLVGLVLVLGVSFAGLNLIGIILGLGAAVTYSCYIIIGNRLLKNIDSMLATTIVCTAAAVVFTTAGLVTGQLIVELPLQAWLAIIGISLFATCIGILCFFAGMHRIGATNAAIISTFEPVITVFLSLILLEEKLTLMQALGGLLICAGVVFLQYNTSKSRQVKAEVKENMDL